ncbi:hypothetical protein AgCh_019614 [Apium graveolens]
MLVFLIIMGHIPVEVIGHVLSLIGDAHHVVIASMTCRKWRQAFYNYLHTLKFDDHSEHIVYGRFSGTEIETLICNTIFQTTGLQCLSIAISNTITITSGHGIFLCLRCLSLSNVVVSPLDLSLLLSACQNLVVFSLDRLEFVESHETTTIEFTTSTLLKEVSLQNMSFDNFILKADNLEKLQVRKCSFTAFDLLGKGTLKFLEIEYVIMSHFEIGENFQNLEVVNVNNHQVIWENFHHMIARSAGLTRLKLWFPGFGKILNMESISACFPLLSHLGLKYDLSDELSLHWNATDSNLRGSYHFGNVVVLELQCLFINSCFPLWLEELLKRCPKLRKLVIHGLEFLEVCIKCSSSVIERADLKAQQLDFGMSCISKLMSKYEHVTVQFRYI